MSEHQAQPQGKIIRSILGRKQIFLLTNLVQDEYEKSGMDDEAFALHAAIKLDFRVTDHNVEGARRVLDILSPRSRAPRSQIAEIADLQRRVERLEQRVEVYLSGCRKDKEPPHG
jgi:hypothetical protein